MKKKDRIRCSHPPSVIAAVQPSYGSGKTFDPDAYWYCRHCRKYFILLDSEEKKDERKEK